MGNLQLKLNEFTVSMIMGNNELLIQVKNNF